MTTRRNPAKQPAITEAVFGFLRDYIAREGYAPSVREIADGLHLSSPSIAQYHLDRLEEEGRIKRARSKSRSIRVIEKGVTR